MYYRSSQKNAWRLVAGTAAFAAVLMAMPSQGDAAPQWTRPNSPTANSVALFHFDESSSASMEATLRTGVPAGTMVTHLLNHPQLGQEQHMEHYNFNDPATGQAAFSSDTAPALGASSLGLSGQLRFRAKAIFADANTKHFTTEAWIKWHDTVTSSDLRLGSGDRALRIIRDSANPANDAIGFQGSHGVWRPSSAFAGFANLPDPVADGEWFHVAMVVHNTGMHEHSGHWHFEPGSFAMIFVNGHLLGKNTVADRIDISEEDEELVFHGSDRVQLWQTHNTGTTLVDEFTVYQADPTSGGTVTDGLFANGRGATASADNWMLFE